MKTRLRYINRSLDTNQPDVVIFQKNMVAGQNELAVAWKVIRHCKQNWSHPFIYSSEIELNLLDSYGNYSPASKAEMGDLMVVANAHGSACLSHQGRLGNNTRVHIKNDLARGAININLFNAGRLIARKSPVIPQQTAIFELSNPRLGFCLDFGLGNPIEEGDILTPDFLAHCKTELALTGLHSADIVLHGGGTGSEARAYYFTLENIK